MPSSSLEELLVYGRPSSLNAQKVFVICEECDVQFELKFASAWLKPGENVYPSDKDKDSWNTVVKTEEYHALNPNPTVPTVLLKDGQALWESNTIVRYIARKCRPELAGGSSLEKAAIIEKWMDWQLAQGEKALAVLHNNVVRNPENKRDISVIATSAEQVATWLLKVVERQLEVTSYLGGDEFTVADIPLGIIVCRWKVSMERATELYASKGVSFANVPKTPYIDAWYNRLIHRPSFMSGCVVPERQHASLPVQGELPAWLKKYNAKYNIDM